MSLFRRIMQRILSSERHVFGGKRRRESVTKSFLAKNLNFGILLSAMAHGLRLLTRMEKVSHSQTLSYTKPILAGSFWKQSFRKLTQHSSNSSHSTSPFFPSSILTSNLFQSKFVKICESLRLRLSKTLATLAMAQSGTGSLNMCSGFRLGVWFPICDMCWGCYARDAKRWIAGIKPKMRNTFCLRLKGFA